MAAPAPEPQKNKRKKKEPVRLAIEQQRVVAELLHQNDFIYLKGHMEYRDIRKREETMLSISQAVGLSCKYKHKTAQLY